MSKCVVSVNLNFGIEFFGILVVEMKKTLWCGKEYLLTLVRRNFMLLKYLFSEIFAIT